MISDTLIYPESEIVAEWEPTSDDPAAAGCANLSGLLLRQFPAFAYPEQPVVLATQLGHLGSDRVRGNGHCTRPVELDCAFEASCETCSFFQTSIEFRPTLQAQHDDAEKKGQDHRAALFDQLLTGLKEGEAS
jgi:hypothetical protein